MLCSIDIIESVGVLHHMNNPFKVIHKFKNNNRRNQYIIYIFVGSLIDEEIEKIFNLIENKDFYNTLINLSKIKLDIIEKKYGEY